MRVQSLRDFPQTKFDSEINAPFLLNELGDPRFFFFGGGGVFAKNSLMKKEKRLIVQHNCFAKQFHTGCILTKARTWRRIFNAQPVKIPHFKSLLTRKQAR